MTNKFYFETLDRNLRDVMRCEHGRESNEPFGGLVVLFGGDFRHILAYCRPYLRAKGSREVMVSSLCSLKKLWSCVEAF